VSQTDSPLWWPGGSSTIPGKALRALVVLYIWTIHEVERFC